MRKTMGVRRTIAAAIMGTMAVTAVAALVTTTGPGETRDPGSITADAPTTRDPGSITF